MSAAALRLLTAMAGIIAPLPACAAPPVDLPVPAQFPAAVPAVPAAALPGYGYQQVLADPRLVAVIEAALAHNQDVALALANIAAARAQYRIQGAARLPELTASLGISHADSAGFRGESYLAQGSAATYEIDLFGRAQSLTDAARAKYLGSQAAARATRLVLVADVSNAWLALAANTSLLALAQATAAAARASVALTQKRVNGGIAPLSDQLKAELTLHAAEADIAAQTTAIAQDRNALRLLSGGDVDDANLPSSIGDAAAQLRPVPVGLSSAILLQRPDIQQAELNLQAANAQVEAARAALFPRITLTGMLGATSTALGSLFTGGAFAWSSSALASYPIFRAGAGRQGLKLSAAQRDAALATYRKAIQSAFADVANVLARRATIEDQLAATAAAAKAAAANDHMADRRYQGGVTSYLEKLSAQQTLYAAQKSLVAVQLARATNLVGLYRAVGGDLAGE